MPRLKRAPPYDDDPGCKYIVIDDPWPGNKTGKARDMIYWNFLCAWVRFMLNKEHDPICVYSVNTRNEVIVQLPEEVDIVPILGAHPWVKMLSGGDAQDRERVSYVFAYDYRMKGEPDNHNWLANYPTETGDPPEWIRFPVLYPYPHVSWASPKGRSCADIALPLPPVRQPTPIPDISGFTPYQHPSQLTASTVTNAEARAQVAHREATGPSQLGKRDPFDEETIALRTVKRESETDVKPRIKREDGVRVKTEAVKSEPEPYGPTKAFRAAVEHWQAHAGEPSATTPSSESAAIERVKPGEEPPRDPSDAFVAMNNSQPHEQPAPPPAERKVKGEAEEAPYRPSKQFAEAIEGLQRGQDTMDNQARGMASADDPVKPDPDARHSYMSPAAANDPPVKLEPEGQRRGAERRTIGADSGNQGTTSLKRVKEEPHDGRGKRFRK